MSIFQVTPMNYYEEGHIFCSSKIDFFHMVTTGKFKHNGTLFLKESAPVTIGA